MKTPSVEPVLRSRLLPRISFRMMFALMTVAAIVAAVARSAGSGTAYAIGILTLVGFLLACFVGFAIVFLVSWSIAVLTYRGDTDHLRGSPFAADQLPPQILPPREPEA